MLPKRSVAFEREVLLQFRGHEGEHLLADGPARQQIRSRGLELSRTGAKKSKSKFLFFDEAMDFVEKGTLDASDPTTKELALRNRCAEARSSLLTLRVDLVTCESYNESE